MEKYELYCHGVAREGIGACSWYIIDSCSKDYPNGRGALSGGTQGGATRMIIRAIYEGISRLPGRCAANLYYESLPKNNDNADLKEEIYRVVKEKGLRLTWNETPIKEPLDIPVLPNELLWMTKHWAEESLRNFTNQ